MRQTKIVITVTDETKEDGNIRQGRRQIERINRVGKFSKESVK